MLNIFPLPWPVLAAVSLLRLGWWFEPVRKIARRVLTDVASLRMRDRDLSAADASLSAHQCVMYAVTLARSNIGFSAAVISGGERWLIVKFANIKASRAIPFWTLYKSLRFSNFRSKPKVMRICHPIVTSIRKNHAAVYESIQHAGFSRFPRRSA
ncbi:hypothetical protein [Bradyrhizobium macuxiense]|uniref:hypothetical protein n=1 Tax=Bradyrhizobium macuxiense TaxID=1755647 RepID=UPI0010A963AB|nr:hypothetical protein [Bradyrhizobium macuxiense]